ncbi:uncharacterized protein LOC120933565 [Rana temporaria]|uniref:uncharacterized protein LOC120933565 n=1 Tax=Rana temporaria TaxID=8407 RepID=UPI001AAD997E|nr:uncharacterized protein LOC120933565 [Rana temporaria]
MRRGWCGEMHGLLLAGVAVLCLTLPYLVHAQPLPDNLPTTLLKTECRDRYFYIWGDKTFFGSLLQWQLEAINDTGSIDIMKGARAAQCGYTPTTDLYGNLEIRISFLGCWVNNTKDSQFGISVQIRVYSGMQSVAYIRDIKCSPDRSWDVREIICEENYMEVSVQRLAEDDKIKFQQTAPATRISQTYRVEFLKNQTTILAEDAFKRGYDVYVTLTRVVFRAPYNTPESQVLQVGDYHLDAVLSRMLQKQTLRSLIIDTTMACAGDPPVFQDLSLSWLSPALLGPLVTENVKSCLFTMGINGDLLLKADIEANKYIFNDRLVCNGSSIVNVTVPIGAPGGYSESNVVNNSYVTTYRINLLLQRQWMGENEDDNTTHTQYKPVVTPAIKQRPIFLDYTIKKDRYFNVSLGNFYSDVNLKSFVILRTKLPLDTLGSQGMQTFSTKNSNNTQVFFLTVPFSSYLVEQMYLGGPKRRYRLHVTYVMSLVPKEKIFTYSDVVECILEDVVPPAYNHSCQSDKLVLDVKRGTLDMYWLPYIRNLPLTNELITSQNYLVQNTDAAFHLEVPYPSVGLIYEVATLSAFHVRLDFTLRDNQTLKVESSYSFHCIFSQPMSVCLSNGSMIAFVNGSMTKPKIDARRTHLKDPTCKPLEATETLALFSFSAYTCGTIQKFDSNYLIYENEVVYDQVVLFPNQPIISRDSNYRMTIRCRYPLKDTLWLSAQKEVAPIMMGLGLLRETKVLRRRARTHMAELRIAKDDTYTSFYHLEDFPVSVEQADSLYLQANVPSTNLVSLLQDCWATTFPNHDDHSRWNLVVDGCATKEGADALSTTIHLSPDYSAQLHVKLNGEVNGQVYIHCQVLLCDPKSTDGCFQTCDKTTGSVSGKRETSAFSEVVSAGPVKVGAKNEVGYQHLAETKSWSTWSWVLSIGLGVIAALTVGAVCLAVRLYIH